MSEKRRIILDTTLDLPENIAVIKADRTYDAYRQAEESLRHAPVNVAVWNKPGEWVSPELDEYINNILTRRIKTSRHKSSFCNSRTELKSQINDYFNMLAKRENPKKKDQFFLKQFEAKIEKVLMPIFDLWPDYRLQFVVSEERTLDRHTINFDRKALFSKRNNDGLLPFHGQAIRMSIPLAGPGTAFFDNKDILSKGKASGVKSLKEYFCMGAKHGTPQAWNSKNWSVSFSTGSHWTHTPAAQSIPQSGGKGIFKDKRAVLVAYLVPR